MSASGIAERRCCELGYILFTRSRVEYSLGGFSHSHSRNWLSTINTRRFLVCSRRPVLRRLFLRCLCVSMSQVLNLHIVLILLFVVCRSGVAAVLHIMQQKKPPQTGDSINQRKNVRYLRSSVTFCLLSPLNSVLRIRRITGTREDPSLK